MQFAGAQLLNSRQLNEILKLISERIRLWLRWPSSLASLAKRVGLLLPGKTPRALTFRTPIVNSDTFSSFLLLLVCLVYIFSTHLHILSSFFNFAFCLYLTSTAPLFILARLVLLALWFGRKPHLRSVAAPKGCKLVARRNSLHSLAAALVTAAILRQSYCQAITPTDSPPVSTANLFTGLTSLYIVETATLFASPTRSSLWPPLHVTILKFWNLFLFATWNLIPRMIECRPDSADCAPERNLLAENSLAKNSLAKRSSGQSIVKFKNLKAEWNRPQRWKIIRSSSDRRSFETVVRTSNCALERNSIKANGCRVHFLLYSMTIYNPL